MRKMKWLAALLALCLLTGLIPAATMEDLTIDGNADTPMEIVLGDDVAEDGLDIPPEIGVSEDDELALKPEDIDLSGLELALEGEYGDAATPNGDVGETLVHIVKPEDGSTVETGNVEIWLTWTFTGGDAREIAAKLLPTVVEVIHDGQTIASKSISTGTLVFLEEGAHYFDVTLDSPGTYVIRARTPGGSGYAEVTFEVAKGEEPTPEPSVTPTPAPTPEPIVTVGKDGFGVDQNGVLRQYVGSTRDIVIPNRVNAIGEDTFKQREDIDSVTTHSGVTRILPFAFSECGPLDKVTLAKGLEFIGEGAFFSSGLKRLDIPEGVKVIETGAFHQSQSLESISFPASLEYLGTYMLGFSEKLKTVTFAEGCRIDILDKDTFYSCTALKNVNIPESVRTLGQYAFAECKALTHLKLPDNLTTIMCYAFQNCPNLKELEIPASVTTIGTDVFDGCTALTLVVVKGSYAEQYAREQGLSYRTVSAPTPVPTATPAPKVKLSKCTATVKSQVYTGKALKPAITVKYGKVALKKGTDYTVTYAKNKAVGTATATLKGKGKYTGTKKVSFKILPPAVALSQLKAGVKSFSATWKKGTANTGYQLQYALKKNFSGAKTVKVAKARTLKATVKALKSGKTYYVRVRAYKTVGRKNYYSAWSAVKRVKVK